MGKLPLFLGKKNDIREVQGSKFQHMGGHIVTKKWE
jgi:hypothetical protein